jgi:ectoine hydroxylase-related dioxygenase (phytanoyl-CoA dioxygenase family)
MEINQILQHPPLSLTDEQRRFYFDNGYLLVESAVPENWLNRLRDATNEMIDRSREITISDSIWDLEKSHSPEDPRLRRLTSPNDHHDVYWEYASSSLITDIVADLVGPDVKFHHSKLNFKWAHGGEEVKWHQDIQFWPHTNYSPLTVGLYLYECNHEQGPLVVLPKSHKKPLYDQYNDSGQWTGCLSAEDAGKLNSSRAVELSGPAGSLTIHNCRMLHSSMPNRSSIGRPLLLNAYSSADAMPYTPVPTDSKYYQTIVRGQTARWAHHDERPCQIPPDWSGGYTSIFALQQEETM